MHVEPLPASGLYRLLADEVIYGVRVPAGAEWNGASIPRSAWTALGLTPYHPRVMRASCVHDHDYRVRIGLRRIADLRFRSVLLEDGVPPDVAALMYAAVRIGGTAHWMDAEDLAAFDPGMPPDDLL